MNMQESAFPKLPKPALRALNGAGYFRLERRYGECITENNGTLVRCDIIQNFRNLYDATGDETIKQKALELIEIENDPRYRNKYASFWKVS